jgi:tetratricopeptide (TPR) repeat protein
MLAEYAFKEKNTEKAIVEYTEALKIFSTWPERQFNLATLCGEAKHYQSAVLHMKEYLELVPDSPCTGGQGQHYHLKRQLLQPSVRLSYRTLQQSSSEVVNTSTARLNSR